jgi:mersacidin/lichenicidin family type 2 lantibiotic
MTRNNIIRAWKDPEYRTNLTAHERALLPANPAGSIDEGKLAEVAGGARIFTWPIFTCFFCTGDLGCPYAPLL